jgi:hypothetical protein
MPNWCQNILVVNHLDNSKLDWLEDIISNEKLCNTVIPVEEELESPLDYHDIWGCKWDITFDSVEKKVDGYRIFNFETPWSPPKPVINELFKMGFVGYFYYYEEGCNFTGILSPDNDIYINNIPSTNEQIQNLVPKILIDLFCIQEIENSDDEFDEHDY